MVNVYSSSARFGETNNIVSNDLVGFFEKEVRKSRTFGLVSQGTGNLYGGFYHSHVLPVISSPVWKKGLLAVNIPSKKLIYDGNSISLMSRSDRESYLRNGYMVKGTFEDILKEFKKKGYTVYEYGEDNQKSLDHSLTFLSMKVGKRMSIDDILSFRD